MYSKSRPFYYFLCFIILIACTPQTETGDSEAEAEEPERVDRNMFGMGMPRGLILNTEKAADGYVMFFVANSASTYLINRMGEVVHEWKSNYGTAGGYLLDDGTLSATAYDIDFPVFAGGGEGGRLQKISWDSKVLWDFEYANEEEHHHHDFDPMPNGNFLAIAWESKSYEESIAAGRDPEKIPQSGLWPDKIVEIEPDGRRHGKIVWEWHMWDHMIQDHDPTKANYGNPALHPELLDINLGRSLPPQITQDSMDILQARGGQWRNQTAYNRGSDLYHVNAINYNSKLDQIVFSSPNLGEIFIIDHSTTTEEAKGHRGGRSGKGGDYLYRWGNPENYREGEAGDRRLYGQHDVRWIEEGKPGEGNLTIFNNDVPYGPDSLDYSAVYEITPPQNPAGTYLKTEGQAFGPEEPTWVYTAPDSLSFYASFISGAHRMENGHTFINEGPKARFFEVTADGEVVWDYWVPYRGEIRQPNGDPTPVVPFTFIQFRSTFIPADHSALEGRDLVPLDPQPEVFEMPPPPKE